VNLANRVLTIPRSKHGGARHVPLNDTATAILRTLPEPVPEPLGLPEQGREDTIERDELPTACVQPGGAEG
jgi:hypothetical protein